MKNKQLRKEEHKTCQGECEPGDFFTLFFFLHLLFLSFLSPTTTFFPWLLDFPDSWCKCLSEEAKVDVCLLVITKVYFITIFHFSFFVFSEDCCVLTTHTLLPANNVCYLSKVAPASQLFCKMIVKTWLASEKQTLSIFCAPKGRLMRIGSALQMVESTWG